MKLKASHFNIQIRILSRSLFYSAPMVLALLSTGCLSKIPSSTDTPTTASTTSATVTIPDTAKAVRIYFSNLGTLASFSPVLPAGGTVPGLNQGFAASTFFNANNQPISLPTWIKKIEVGISGASATDGSGNQSLDSKCASFNGSTHTCNFGNGNESCGAPANTFNVSEVHCQNSASLTTSAAPGSTKDPVYIRIIFDRATDKLASTENVMVTLNYVASALHSAPTNPSNCTDSSTFFTTTSLTSQCSDHVWNSFLLKSSSTTSSSPFLLLVPPSTSLPVGTDLALNRKRGTQIQTKQFILPLAQDSTVDVFQISRGDLRSTPFTMNPNGTGTPVCQASDPSSPGCIGVVFYSMTLYRI